MQFNKLFSELKRRNVFKVGTAYAIVGWLLIQIVVAVNEPLSLPGWFDTAIILLVAIGFPIALIVAWAFEMTPEGIRKTDEVSKGESIAPKTGNKLNRIIIAALVVLIGFLLIERFFFAGEYDVVEGNTSDKGLIDKVIEEKNRSVAVLPFADFSPDNDQEWFADGLTEEILNSLVRTPDLKVAARTSSFKFKGTQEEIPVIAKALGVDHVLEGSVRRTTDRLRVTAQLIRASDGFHLWSDTYDRTPDDAIVIQEELAISIAKALNTAMDSSALANMFKIGTSSVNAYNAYLEGLNADLTEYDFVRSKRIANLNKARSIDPSFAEAHFAAARFWAQEFAITQIGSSTLDKDFDAIERNFTECIRAAIQTSNSAVDRLKYRLTEADVNLRWKEAEQLYDDFFKERPNDFYMMESYIRMLIKLKKFDKALGYLKRLEEGQGGNNDTRDFLVNFYHRVNSYKDSDRVARQSLEEDPTNYRLMYQVQRALLWTGQVELARQAHDNYLNYQVQQDESDSALAYVVRMRQLCAEQKRKEAEVLFVEYKERKYDLTNMWHVYNSLGMISEATELLRVLDTPETVRQFSSYLWYPQFDARKYPEIMKIVARENIDLPPPKAVPFALSSNQSL